MQCNTPFGNIPIGRPLTLNTDTLGGAVRHTANNTTNGAFAPWSIARLDNQPRGQRSTLVGCHSRLFCKMRGWQHKAHVQDVEGEPNESCRKGHCEHCRQLEVHHTTAGCETGPFCSLPVHAQSESNQWCKKSWCATKCNLGVFVSMHSDKSIVIQIKATTLQLLHSLQVHEGIMTVGSGCRQQQAAS